MTPEQASARAKAVMDEARSGSILDVRPARIEQLIANALLVAFMDGLSTCPLCERGEDFEPVIPDCNRPTGHKFCSTDGPTRRQCESCGYVLPIST